MNKKMICGAVAMMLGAPAANATVSGSVILCDAHDWQRFADAMERQDQAALQAMATEPELRVCEFFRTIEVMVPAPRPMPVRPWIPVLTDRASGPFPGQAPGQQLGQENDSRDSGSDAGGDGAGGGSAPSASEPSGSSEPR